VFSRKDVPLGVALILLLICQITQNPHFGGVNRLFQAKCANIQTSYYQNYCSDSNQVLQNDKGLKLFFDGDPKMFTTVPRWRTAAILKKMKKIVISHQPF